jgi:hypothetical protein
MEGQGLRGFGLGFGAGTRISNLHGSNLDADIARRSSALSLGYRDAIFYIAQLGASVEVVELLFRVFG